WLSSTRALWQPARASSRQARDRRRNIDMEWPRRGGRRNSNPATPGRNSISTRQCMAEQEQRGSTDHDRRPGGRVPVPGQRQTAAYRQQPQQTGANGHLLRGARMSLGGGRGNDQQRGDQQHADDLHGQGDHQGDQQHQRQTQTSHRQTLDPRQLLVHGDGQQRSPQGHQQQQDQRAAAQHPVELETTDGQQVAEQVGQQVDTHLQQAHGHQSQGQSGGRQDAQQGV